MLVCGGNGGYLRIIDPNSGSELYNLDVAGGDFYGVTWGSNNVIAATRGTVYLFAPFDNDGPVITIAAPAAGFSTTLSEVTIQGRSTIT